MGKEGREMFDKEERAEGIGLECLERFSVVYLGGRSLRVEDTRDAEGEAEIVGGRWEQRFAARRGGGNGGFV